MPKIHPWPASIIAYFTVVICAATALVVHSLQHKTQLVRKDYYEQEVLYQDQIERIKRTQPFLSQIKAIQEGDQIVLQLPVDHTSTEDFKGSAWIYRPSDSSLDQKLQLEQNASGRYTHPLALKSGLWKVKLDWKVAEEEFYFEDTLVMHQP